MRTGGRTDRHDEASGRFSQFCEGAYKLESVIKIFRFYTLVLLLLLLLLLFFIIIIIIILVIAFMQGIYNYTPETNHVSRLRNIAAVLYLQFVLRVKLFRP